MSKIEYEITSHSAAEFKDAAYFCTEKGECNLEEIPGDQIKILLEILNEKGAAGWELVQMSFGRDGIICFWKRRVEN